MAEPKYENVGRPEAKVIEECAKMIHILMKVDRFGWFNYHPDDPAKIPNMELVKREMDDVNKAFIRLENHMRDIDYKHWKDAKEKQNSGA